MRHDEAFKTLLQTRPGDLIEAFAPDLIALHGPAATVQIESVELLPRVKGLRRSRYVDFAVTVRWPGVGASDASRAVLVLTEHFSAPTSVELSRVALYTAAMMHRHNPPGLWGPHRARWGGRRATMAAYHRRSRCRHDSGGLPTESSCDKARG